jgi:formylglycine-generating enzyme required for sulfatase activity
MARIFISYRRDDSAGIAGRLYDRLEARFGRDNIFMDIDAIPLGVDFRKHLHGAVGECDVLLAVIGRNWFGRTPEGARRLDDPKDFVRIEIEAALARDIPVIPVLIDKVMMPPESELPASVAGLAYRNGIVVDHGRDFHGHVDRLIRGIEWLIQPRATPQSQSQPKPTALQPVAIEPALVPDEPAKLIINSVGMKLVLIPAGAFLMGSPDSDQDAQDDEKPQHRVRITRPFYLGVNPVTQGQYRAVTGANPSHFKGSDDLPVECVSWKDAIAFCNKLSERDGLKPYYQSGGGAPLGGEGYRLPTEAEWEYACRAGSTTRFSFGDDEASFGEYAWFSGNSDSKTHPVGQKRPNAFGLYDMHGNVGEWCWDWREFRYYGQSPVDDPVGPSQAALRVFRGGRWDDDPQASRSAYRDGFTPDYRDYGAGFRLARVQSGQ